MTKSPLVFNQNRYYKGFAHTGLSANLLTQAFPFYLAFRADGQLVQIGDAMQRLCPHLTPGQPIDYYFQLRQPSVEFQSLTQPLDNLLRLECLANQVQFEGRAIYVEQQELIYFLGSPHLDDAYALNSLVAKVANRSSRGAASDMLLLLQARATSLSDTRRLAEKIAEQRAELRQALRQAELATAVLEQAADAIEITDADARLLYVNPAFERITGYQRDEVMGKTVAELFCLGQPDEILYQEIAQTIAAGKVWQGSCMGRRKDGSSYPQEVTIFPIHNKAGQITNRVAIKRDVSDRQRTQEKLGNSLSLLQATFEATADGILVTNGQGNILNFNQKFTELWQISTNQLIAWDEFHDLKFIARFLKHPYQFSSRIQELYTQPQIESHDILELKDGRYLEGRSCPQRSGDSVIGRVWSFRDVTERLQTEAKIRYQASHDLLTGLPNRMFFNQRLADALAEAIRQQKLLAVMFIDLDRFKLINDSLGHAAGDQLLQEVAQRLRTCLRKHDLVARWAGDEFTLLLTDINCVEDAVTIAQKILWAMKADFELEGHRLHISSSIGIAVYPNDGEDAETLLKNADAALYRAKDSGRNGYHLYTSAINSETSEWLALESHLHRALERREFVLYYQPQVNVVTGEITQMEALLRWQHPEMGLVSPAKFIPLAEENGLIVPIGEWVLRTACAQTCAWQAAGLPPVRIAVNLSARQLRQPNLVEMVAQVLSDTGLAPRYLELEITETTVMKNVELTKTILCELHRMGVSMAMDDFGTGYSSLGYLKKFPFNTLKIDQSFVRDLTTDPNDKAIVAAIIAMGRVLNLKLVAEGVETKVQEHSLLSLDCEEMQGYLFSPPLSTEEATLLLESQLLHS
ncbi:MAG: EAL domain-containing protein [Elainella sp. C42_A2020_010]|nr:EAL domain-containing protein [Elainella sp. C42_A2020_010]